MELPNGLVHPLKSRRVHVGPTCPSLPLLARHLIPNPPNDGVWEAC